MIDRLAVFVLTYHNHTKEQLDRCLWSIEEQEIIDFEPFIVVNSTDKTYFQKVQEWFGDDYSVIETESDGYTGKGTNSVIEYYRESLISEFSHMCIIDGDDYYYPMAFDLINQIHEKSNFDFLSGMSPHPDSLRTTPPNDQRPAVPYKEGRWVWTFGELRVPVYPSLFWINEGKRIPGGEITLCLSNKAAKNEKLKCLEGPNRVDDYFFLLNGIISHMNKEFVFVSTDCNDIYIYDCAGDSISQGDHKFDSKLGWPFDVDGLVLSESTKEKYRVLEGITRQHLPYVTMPQVWDMDQKVKYLKENDLS
jgi:hypothetical protein